MQLTTVLFTALTGTLALAAPATNTNTNTKRACTQTFPAGVSTISLTKAAGSPSSTQALSWSVPAGSGGPCTLVWTVPAGYPVAWSGNPQVNVIDVNGPAPGAIVGTVNLVSDPAAARYVYINSFTCRPNMQYNLVLAGEQGGSVSFAEGNGAGIAMTYNC